MPHDNKSALRKAGILESWQAGMTGREIAARFGVTKQYVSLVVRAAGTDPASRRKAKRKL